MPKRLDFKLTQEEEDLLLEAMKAHPKIKKRAKVILKLNLGATPGAVATEAKVTIQTIYNWVNRWHREEKKSIRSLADKPKGRSNRIVDEFYLRHLETALNSKPSKFGYKFPIWTRKRLQEHLKQVTRGKQITIEWLGKIIKRQGYKNFFTSQKSK